MAVILLVNKSEELEVVVIGGEVRRENWGVLGIEIYILSGF